MTKNRIKTYKKLNLNLDQQSTVKAAHLWFRLTPCQLTQVVLVKKAIKLVLSYIVIHIFMQNITFR